MLASYFNYIFVHLRQKVRVRPEVSPKFLPTFGPNPSPTRKARPVLGTTLTIRSVRLVRTFKQRTKVPYPYHYKKHEPYKRTVLLRKN